MTHCVPNEHASTTPEPAPASGRFQRSDATVTA